MSSLEHPAVAKVAAALIEMGRTESAEKIKVLPGEARTAAAAAEALGIEVGAIANSLILRADGRPLLALTSGAHRADLEKLGSAIGAKEISMADPKFVKQHTGQVIGGVAPLGHPEKIATLVDTALAKYETIWAAAGHAKTVFPLTFADLVEITDGKAIEIGVSSSRAEQ